MADIGVSTIMLRDAILQVGSDTFQRAVERVEFVPEPEFEWLPANMSNGARPPLFRGVRWTCQVGFAQDLAVGSLTNYLIANAGQRRTVVFTPVAGGRRVSAAVILTPGRVGGYEGTILTSQATFVVDGEPAILPAA